MCGKFSAQYAWAEVHEFSQALTGSGGGDDGPGEGGNDADITYRVAAPLPVIVWDSEEQRRKVVRMRWGFPSPKDWRRPQPIHARAETIDELRTFRGAFAAGHRGIVLFRTFNEGEEVEKASGKTETRQWTIDPKDGRPRGFAFLWQRFEIADLPAPMLACVMVTVPANELIRRSIKSAEADPRMPAILDDDVWGSWLGEDGARRQVATQGDGGRELDGCSGAEEAKGATQELSALRMSADTPRLAWLQALGQVTSAYAP